MPSCWVSPTLTRETETYGTALECFASSPRASSLLPSLPKAFCVGFFPFVQMESLFQLCNYCSSDFRAVSPLQICAGSHFVCLEKLSRCGFLIAPRVTFVIFSSLVCLSEQLFSPGRSSQTCLLASELLPNASGSSYFMLI